MDVTNADEFIDDIGQAESKEWRELFAETDAWNAAGNDLVGVPGQEVSWANLHSGHINVFNAQWLLAAEATGAGWTDSKSGGTEWVLPAFYARLKQDPDAIVQFNHPNAEAYGTFDEWHHVDRQLDSQIEMFEYKQDDAEYLQNWHDASTLTGNVAEVTVDAESQSAGQQASAVLMRVGARYSDPAVSDIVYLNEYTLDADGRMTFAATVPGGDLDDYVLAVNVAGETGRYLVSLDPNGPTPVEPPVEPPVDDGGGGGDGGDGGNGDNGGDGGNGSQDGGNGSQDGGNGGQDGVGSENGSDPAASGDGDPLATTGAVIPAAAIAGGVVLVAVGGVVLVARRRRVSTED